MVAIASAELVGDLEHAVPASPGRMVHFLGNAAMAEAS